MRSYSNYLLFEDVLDNLPSTLRIMSQAVSNLLEPEVTFIEQNCGTLLGTVVATSYGLEGKIEVATDEPFSKTRLDTLLSEGVYTTRIRNLHSCQSKEGICKECYVSTTFDTFNYPVGSSTVVPSYINYQYNVIIGTGHPIVSPLSESNLDYDYFIVFHEGVIVDSSTYSVSGALLPGGGNDGSILSLNFNTLAARDYVVQFFKRTSEPFLGYIARSYSGSVLGMRPLIALDTMLNPKLYSALLQETFINDMIVQLSSLRIVPDSYLNYAGSIHDRLEQILYILYIYSVYGSTNL